METTQKKAITIQTKINAPVDKVWKTWTEPQHITGWCYASDDWHAPHAENDLRTKGKFCTTMAAKDGSVSFDMEGEYTRVVDQELIEYVMSDGRRVQVRFDESGNSTLVTETFDPESQNPVEMQRAGWQAILDNFKKYTESVS